MRQPGSAYRSGEEIYNISYFIEKPNQFIRIFQNTIVQVGDVHLTGSNRKLAWALEYKSSVVYTDWLYSAYLYLCYKKKG